MKNEIKKLKGKKVKVVLTFFDENRNSEVVQILNPNPLLIPSVGDTFSLTVFGLDTDDYNGSDYTVNKVSKSYTIDFMDDYGVLSIFVEII